MEDLRDTAKMILDQGNVLKDKNLGRDCSWCQYKEICQAEILGLDIDYIIKKEYEEGKRGKDGK